MKKFFISVLTLALICALIYMSLGMHKIHAFETKNDTRADILGENYPSLTANIRK